MPRTKNVTAEQAKKILSEVRRVFRPYLDKDTPESGPKLVRDFDWGYGRAPWAVVWEEGPFEWAMGATEEGIDEELSSEGYGIVRHRAIVQPAGVHCEVYTSWALGIYSDD